MAMIFCQKLITTAGLGKFTGLLIEDVTSVLLNIDGLFFYSIHLSENWKWHMLSGGFLVTLRNSGLYSLDTMLSRVAMYHCIYLLPNSFIIDNICKIF